MMAMPPVKHPVRRRRLTPRSRRAPTAAHVSPAWAKMFIVPCGAYTLRCRARLTSNVRPHQSNLNLMRFEGTLTNWNDDRGFGYIESSQGGEPIFVHISAWPRGTQRPRLQQLVSFEIEVGPKGKRARNVQPTQAKPAAPRKTNDHPAQWGTATLFAIPAFIVVYVIVAILWRPPLWVAGLYFAASAITFIVYAADKSAAARGSWRTQESTLHLLSIAGGWPGALLAQQVLRHKSTKQEFRQVFWGTVALNIAALVVLASPARALLLGVK